MTDTDELIETLERLAGDAAAGEKTPGAQAFGPSRYVEIRRDTLPHILSAIKENKRLREALEPFAAACAKADQHADEVKRAGMGSVSNNATPGWGVRYGHLKAARAALSKLKQAREG